MGLSMENLKRAAVDLMLVFGVIGVLAAGYCGWTLFEDHQKTLAMWGFINLNLQQQQQQLQQKNAQTQTQPPQAGSPKTE